MATHRKTTVYPFFVLASVFLTFLVPPQIVVSQDSAGKDKLIVETLLRLKRYDVSSNDNWKGAVHRHLQTIKGTPRYLELVKIFDIRESIPELLEIAISRPTDTIGVNAAAILLEFQQTVLLQKVIQGKDKARALALAQAVSLGVHPARMNVLKTLVINTQLSRQIRNVAVKGVGTTKQGQQYLIDLLNTGRIPEELMFVTGTALFASSDPLIVKSATKLVTLPTTANATPLPPVNELLRLQGDAVSGKIVFDKNGTCIKCHKVGDAGKEVGPSLTEIGSKLSKEALFVSILDPSAGVSHNYETFAIALNSGNVLSGIVISRNDEEVVVRNAEGIDRVIPASEIDEIIKTGVSLMPADLQKVMTIQELVNVVAYLTQLKKPPKDN